MPLPNPGDDASLGVNTHEEEKLTLMAGSAVSEWAVLQACSVASVLPVPESHSYSPCCLLGNSPKWEGYIRDKLCRTMHFWPGNGNLQSQPLSWAFQSPS